MMAAVLSRLLNMMGVFLVATVVKGGENPFRRTDLPGIRPLGYTSGR